MSRPKLVLFSLLAVFLASAAGATSASAIYNVEGTELIPTETIDGAVGVTQINSTIGETKMSLECTTNKMVGTNSIETAGLSSLEISYNQCYVYTINKGNRELTGCKVAEPIVSSVRGVLLKGAGGAVEDQIESPLESETLATINVETITGKSCFASGKSLTLNGSYIGSTGDEGEIEKTEHDLTFNSTGSAGLTLNGAPASITSTISRVKTVSGRLWSGSYLWAISIKLLQRIPAVGNKTNIKVTNLGSDEFKILEEFSSTPATLEIKAKGCEGKTLETGKACETEVERKALGTTSYIIRVEIPVYHRIIVLLYTRK
jgi:hypothetical protein